METVEVSRGNTLLSTIHGSNLYGLSHEDSDEDWYFVTEHGKARHKKVLKEGKEIDVVYIGLSAFLIEVNKGTPQALEALCSNKAKYAEGWDTYFSNMTAYTPNAGLVYRRTIRNLAKSDSVKLRRHAVRLAFNLMEMRDYGRFKSEMTEAQIETANELVENLRPIQLYKTVTDAIER